jgi:hypothetical protein
MLGRIGNDGGRNNERMSDFGYQTSARSNLPELKTSA